MSGGILGEMDRPKGNCLLDMLDPNSPDYSRRNGGGFVTGLLDSMYSGVTLPRDVYQGTVDLNTEEGTGRVLDMAGLAMTGGIAGGVQKQAGETVLGSGPIRSTGLPMDEASRLARAAEQGYTIDAYRGEGANLAGDGYRLGHKDRHDTGFLGEAIYATSDPQIASTYANMKAMRTMPADEAAQVLPLKLKLQNPLEISGEMKRQIAELPQWERDEWLRDVVAKGYDGVTVRFEGGGAEYVIPDPSQIRSRFAKFDPASAGTAGILGAGAGVAMMPTDGER